MSKLLDANVILRYLLCDIAEQAEAAYEMIEQGAFTLPEVIAEVVYVLRGVYKVDKSSICSALCNLMDEIYIENKSVMINALEVYAAGKVDFVDAILISRAKLLGDTVISFNKKLNTYLK